MHDFGNCRRRLCSDAGSQPKDALPGNGVTRIRNHAEKRQSVLHVRAFKKSHTAAIFKRNPAASEFKFKRVRMMGGAKKDGNLRKRHPLLLKPLHRVSNTRRFILGSRRDGNDGLFQRCGDGPRPSASWRSQGTRSVSRRSADRTTGRGRAKRFWKLINIPRNDRIRQIQYFRS